MQSFWAFVLLGNNQTGKTTFQKHVLTKLCGGQWPKQLVSNSLREINHPHVIRKIRTLFTANRSYQEKLSKYKSVDNYFNRYFRAADIAIFSSHVEDRHGILDGDVSDIIRSCHNRFYNVCAVFFENSISTSPAANESLSQLDWDERWYVDNPVSNDKLTIERQIELSASEFVQMLVERTRGL